MKKRIVVLGCGLVGRTLACDLAADPDFDVAVADVSRENLNHVAATTKNLATIQADLGTPSAIQAVIKDFDVVVGAMPSTLGLQTLKAVIDGGKSFSDISFMAEDPMTLDDLARQRSATVVFDCGVAPGLANMIIGHCHAQLDETTDVSYYVGGLPKHPQWPYKYKAPFAPADVVEEYTRPARLVENGRQVVKPALSEPELIDFPQVGTLEAFNTDGLRSLLHTVKAANMREKTLRYPGHAELMRVFRETGLFSKVEVDAGGKKVRPLDVTSRLLFSKWRLEPGEEEFTILRVIVEGAKARSTPALHLRPLRRIRRGDGPTFDGENDGISQRDHGPVDRPRRVPPPRRLPAGNRRRRAGNARPHDPRTFATRRAPDGRISIY